MSLGASGEPLLADESGARALLFWEQAAHNLSPRRGGSNSLARIEAPLPE